MDVVLFNVFNGFSGTGAWLDVLIIFNGVFLSYWIVAVVLFASFLKQWRLIVFEAFIIAGISRFVVADIIRFFYNRPRPFELHDVYQLIAHDIGYAFPSGHAVFFFALAMSVFLYHKGWGSLFFAAALFISMARIMGGIHWPSDVLGGAVLGISIALCIHFLAVGSNFVKRQKGNLPSEAGL